MDHSVRKDKIYTGTKVGTINILKLPEFICNGTKEEYIRVCHPAGDVG